MAANLSTLLDHAVVTNRHPARRAILRLWRGRDGRVSRRVGRQRDFTEIQTPKIVACRHGERRERLQAGLLWATSLSGAKSAVLQADHGRCFERVFEVGPVFRAEPHDTTRHINEYVSLDAEMGFIENHFTVMALLRDVLAGILATFSEQYRSRTGVVAGADADGA